MFRLLARRALRHSVKCSQVSCLIYRQKHSAKLVPPIVQFQAKDIIELDTPELNVLDPAAIIPKNIIQIPNINIGDYVEVFSNGQYSGMVIGQKRSSGNLQQLTILLRNGKRYTARSDSVAFIVPSFYTLPEVSQICSERLDLNNIDSQGLLQNVPKEYSRAIYQYQGSLRLNKALAHEKLESLYEHFCQPGSDVISLDNLTSFVFGSADTTSLQRHVTFLHLASDNVHFTPATSKIGSEEWKLRSKEDSGLISQIITSIRTRDKSYSDFLSRAKSLLEFYNAHADPVLGTFSQSALDMVPKYVKLTATDKKFIDFITNWIRSPRVITASPYEVFVPTILKALKYYDNLFFDKPLAIRFLKEIGMFKPWDNVYLLQDGAVAEEFFWTDRAKENDKKMHQYATAFLSGNDKGLKKDDPCDSIRHDFGELPVYTIDDPSAKEIDDGVSIERIPEENAAWLHVHIADPTTYISPTHELSQLIQQKVQTLYLPERHFPMLPEALSSQKFSLGSTAQKNAKGSQYAMSFSTKIDSQGNLLDYKVRPSLVKNINKIYYDDLDEILLKKVTMVHDPLFSSSKTFSHPSDAAFTTNVQKSSKQKSTVSAHYENDLLDIFDLANKHLSARTRNGALFFGQPSPSIGLLEPLDLPRLHFTKPEYVSSLPPLRVSLDKFQFSPARQMVAETMIIGGRVASLFAKENNVNILFRSQNWNPNASPEELSLREELFAARDPETGWVKYQDMVKFVQILPPAFLSTIPDQPHVTMGIENGYTKATSPLRRFTDVLVHWQLKAHLLNEKAPFSKEHLDMMIPELETRGKRLAALQTQSTQFWVVNLLHRMSADSFLHDMEWNCIVSLPSKIAQTELGGVMEVATGTLLDLGIRARIEKLKRNVETGEIIKVRISSIDQLKGRITLEMIE
ncbi:hypothetical protein G6F46_008598 [Rhizopus delemar]|uniref:RNB domain-containing protein n=2 Tax=Rhizopus TaxID=4842 RepID=A0A9P7CK73_9FUNG|nr:hypothetical protein G6F55_010034 [Rhizopus delemar]KAG1549139.1 hypothetical protein G6F51_003242 [Rhizopus arrhizus]KAG1494160.1 hypothetical protein G6F54_008072 [Rhizopus delemar]KAG1508741.1 hypothetical protein G6F53_007966 [Rhizopus delemar]KAG1525893.1 hypothetical protein G6F52_002926 [Rhizopus delemar]